MSRSVRPDERIGGRNDPRRLMVIENMGHQVAPWSTRDQVVPDLIRHTDSDWPETGD